MEDIKILEWIKNSPGCGYNTGHGYGSGAGSGSYSSYSFGYDGGSGFSDNNNSDCCSGFSLGFGYGHSCVRGFDYDDGSGFGEDNSDFSAIGSDDGTGCGFGYGYGDSIKSFNGKSVYMIDGVQTIISNIKGNLAKGFILRINFTLSPCYICKDNKYFAHGETLKEAKESLRKKIFENMNTNETIKHFLSTFEKEKKYPAKDFYEWHHYLTGSCEMGRKSFMRDKNINFDDMYTVDEFIALCENSYGSEIIKELKERWNCRNGSD